MTHHNSDRLRIRGNQRRTTSHAIASSSPGSHYDVISVEDAVAVGADDSGLGPGAAGEDAVAGRVRDGEAVGQDCKIIILITIDVKEYCEVDLRIIV